VGQCAIIFISVRLLLQSHQAPMAVDQEHIWFEPDKVRCCTSDAVVVAGVPAASDDKVAPSDLMRPTTHRRRTRRPQRRRSSRSCSGPAVPKARVGQYRAHSTPAATANSEQSRAGPYDTAWASGGGVSTSLIAPSDGRHRSHRYGYRWKGRDQYTAPNATVLSGRIVGKNGH
jgi:hypothetical protein